MDLRLIAGYLGALASRSQARNHKIQTIATVQGRSRSKHPQTNTPASGQGRPASESFRRLPHQQLRKK